MIVFIVLLTWFLISFRPAHFVIVTLHPFKVSGVFITREEPENVLTELA
jgi:hypothetical protein